MSEIDRRHLVGALVAGSAAVVAHWFDYSSDGLLAHGE